MNMLMRRSPHTVLTFVFMEQLRKLTQWSVTTPKAPIKV